MPEGNNLLIYSFSLNFSCEKCHCNIPVVVEDNSMQTEQDPDIYGFNYYDSSTVGEQSSKPTG